MDIQYYYFKHDHTERYIAQLPWKIAQMQRAKSGTQPRRDGSANSHCLCRSDTKLKCIDHADRSPIEQEMWQKVLDKSETSARVRAVQMHLNTITTLSALPLTIKCCDSFQSRSAAVALRDMHTDEIDRDWTYDTGAAMCIIGWDHLTAKTSAALTN